MVYKLHLQMLGHSATQVTEILYMSPPAKHHKHSFSDKTTPDKIEKLVKEQPQNWVFPPLFSSPDLIFIL